MAELLQQLSDEQKEIIKRVLNDVFIVSAKRVEPEKILNIEEIVKNTQELVKIMDQTIMQQIAARTIRADDKKEKPKKETPKK